MKLFLVGIGLVVAASPPASAASWRAPVQERPEVQEAANRTASDEALVAVIPLAFRNGWFTIEGRSRRGPLRFVFDTGANAHGLTRGVARRLDLPRVGWTRVQGGSGSEATWLVRGPDIFFGGANARPGHRVIVDDDFVTDPAGIRYDGVIGTRLFERYDVRIDGPDREIRLYEPGRAGGDDLGPPIPMDDLGRALVHFTIQVNGREVGAILDTGAPYTVLNTAAALLAGVELTGEPFTLYPRGVGAATIAAAPIRLASLDLGTTRFAEVDAVVAEGNYTRDLTTRQSSPKLLVRFGDGFTREDRWRTRPQTAPDGATARASASWRSRRCSPPRRRRSAGSKPGSGPMVSPPASSAGASTPTA